MRQNTGHFIICTICVISALCFIGCAAQSPDGNEAKASASVAPTQELLPTDAPSSNAPETNVPTSIMPSNHEEQEPRKLYEPCADDGLSGIGVVRGNTNGNLLHAGGRALCDGESIYYVENSQVYSRKAQLVRYEISTKQRTVLKDDFAYARSVGQLNLIGDLLFYSVVDSSDFLSHIWCYSISDGTSKHIFSSEVSIRVMAVYGKLFVEQVRANRTLVLDYTGKVEAEIPEFLVYGAMDGLLYGYWCDDDSYCCIDSYGQTIMRYQDIVVPIPVAGYLVDINNMVSEDPLDHSGVAIIVDAATGEAYSFEIPELPCASYFNVSEDYIYLQRYWADECGEIYRISWDGKGFQQLDKRVFRCGVNLWGDQLLADYVDCEPMLVLDGEEEPWS